jgi:rod shape-determining protein MreC
LRYTSANADVQVGDKLQTSGLDGIYPAGLPVARVHSVERRVESGFARIVLKPEANAEGVRHVLVLEPVAAQLPPRPGAAAEEAPERARKEARQGPGRKASGAAP